VNKAEQRGYEVGIAETEEALRAEVPAVYRIYCARTWHEALNRAGVEASSELHKPENVFYPEATHPSALLPPQAEAPPPFINPNEEVLPHHLPLSSQQESATGGIALPGASLNKTATALEAEMTSQVFQQDLASTVLPTGDVSKDKEKIATLEADKSDNRTPKIQLRLKQ